MIHEEESVADGKLWWEAFRSALNSKTNFPTFRTKVIQFFECLIKLRLTLQ